MSDRQDNETTDAWINRQLNNVRLAPQARLELVHRITQAIEQAESSTAPVELAPAPVASSLHRNGRERRAWLACGLSGLTALLALAIWYVWPTPWDNMDAQQLAMGAERSWRPSVQGWRPDLASADAEGYPVSVYLRVRPTRWQVFPTSLDPTTVAFDFPGLEHPTRLFALHAGQRVESLPVHPPQQPQTKRSGHLIAAWQEASYVYVLAVPGPTRNYWNLVKASGTSLAEVNSAK
jgi:hypothetical protein